MVSFHLLKTISELKDKNFGCRKYDVAVRRDEINIL
jgi:hypothetical protein